MSSIGDIHKNHRRRLRERYAREGAGSFEPHELLELFLFDVIPRYNTNPIAHRLLDRFGSLHGVLNAPYEELLEVKGIGAKAAEYIVGLSKEFARQNTEAFLTKPLATFERASNFLIWQMNRGDANPVIVIATDGNMLTLATRGFSESVCKMEIVEFCTSVKAVNVLIGCKADVDISSFPTDVDFGGGITLCDVIKISGFSAESVKE